MAGSLTEPARLRLQTFFVNRCTPDVRASGTDARARSGRLQHSQRGIVCSSVTLLTNYGPAHESAVKNLSTGSQFETTIDARPLHNLKILFPGI